MDFYAGLRPMLKASPSSYDFAVTFERRFESMLFYFRFCDSSTGFWGFNITDIFDCFYLSSYKHPTSYDVNSESFNTLLSDLRNADYAIWSLVLPFSNRLAGLIFILFSVSEDSFSSNELLCKTLLELFLNDSSTFLPIPLPTVPAVAAAIDETLYVFESYKGTESRLEG